MKDLSKIKHDIRNHLQIILWALQAEAEDNCRQQGKEAVQAILEAVEGINGGEK